MLSGICGEPEMLRGIGGGGVSVAVPRNWEYDTPAAHSIITNAVLKSMYPNRFLILIAFTLYNRVMAVLYERL